MNILSKVFLYVLIGCINVLPYNSNNFAYNGRFIDTGAGNWSGWGSGQILFKVKNTSYIKVYADIVDPNNTALSVLAVSLDNDSAARTDYYFSTATQTLTGKANVTIPVTNDGQWHTVCMTPNGYNADIFYQISKTTISAIEVENNGVFTTWEQGSTLIQCVGDSWMGASNDWPRLMNTYKIYSIATGGMTCNDSKLQYDYNYNANLNTTDPTAAAVLVSFGVNDYLAGVTQGSFQTSLGLLVDEIRAKQATAKIFLIRVPSNTGTGQDFGKYGTNMSTIAGLKSNCYYVNTSSLDALVTWAGDGYHLDAHGKMVLARYVKATLVAAGIN